MSSCGQLSAVQASSVRRRRDDSLSLQVGNNGCHRFLQVLTAGVHPQLRAFGGFVGAGDACEFFNFAGSSLGVKALGVALLGLGSRPKIFDLSLINMHGERERMAENSRQRRIPVQRPLLPESAAILPYLKALDEDRWYTNRGRLAWQLEESLSERFGCRSHSVISFSSGTIALEAAILAHAGQANPERPLALLPAYTFIATAQAAIRCGYQLHFTDVDPQTWMLDPSAIACHPQLAHAGLILPVAACGRMPDMLGWERVQTATGVPVVIDAAASFEQFLATPGSVSDHVPAAMSFHATKSFTTAEGGAVLWNNAYALLRLAQISNFGLDDTRVCKLPGMNGKMSEYHAAVGLACLDQWPARSARHAAVAAAWSAAARHWPGHIVTTPKVSAAYVLFDARDAAVAESVAKALDAAGIDTRRWYGEALHRQPFLCGEAADPLPVTEDLAARHLGLPAAIDLSADEITAIANAVCPASLVNPYVGKSI